jgi:hypothetical protein
MRLIINCQNSFALCVTLWLASVCQAQVPEMPKPSKEHELLSQFAGDWEVTAETVALPNVEPLKCEGTESAKMVGGFWLVGQTEASMMGMKVNSLLTIGYNPTKKKYVGTFVCSADSTLWEYEGTMDDDGKKLTLTTEGPSPLDPSKTGQYREELELTDKDHKTFTSYMQGEDGKWVKMVTMSYTRKKAE